MPTETSHEKALENPVLEQADEDDKVTSLESRVVFKYNHAAFDGSSRGLLTAWLRMSPGSNRSGQTRNAETGQGYTQHNLGDHPRRDWIHTNRHLAGGV